MSSTSTQKSEIVIDRYGPAESLQLRDGGVLEPGPNEVRIRVAFSGINFADIQMRLGLYFDAPPRPFVPGYEVSGEIEATGANVTRFKVGDQVLAGTLFGGYTSSLIVKE